MELCKDDLKPIDGVNEEWSAGNQYHPGTYEVELRTHQDPSNRSLHTRTYNVRAGTTLGAILDTVIGQRMHHFAFLPYTDRGSWKGCGDHTLHCWAALVRAGIITSPDSVEDPQVSLADEMMITYLTGGTHTAEMVGRGWWFQHDPVEDELTPEAILSNARPTYQFRAL
ncbi:hypothetical protein TWF696_008264 [Orbilia brochopaga]|uniref:Uncharacterized protein n=1 Tax=Orbilia brochopaga TaxID=3140254 RepID=A0AAV9UGB7_9PEZI